MFDSEQIHLLGDSNAAAATEMAAVKQRLLLVEGPLARARTDVARVLQARPSAIPCVWSQPSAEKIAVALLLPADVQWDSLMEPLQARLKHVGDDWERALSELCEENGRGRRSKPKARDKRHDGPLEPSAKRFQQALARSARVHGVRIAVISNGELSDGSDQYVRLEPIQKPATPELCKEEQHAVYVEGVTSDRVCDVRIVDSKRALRLQMEQNGPWVQLLGMAVGAEALRVRIRLYRRDDPAVRLPIDGKLGEIIGISNEWDAGNPSKLQFLSECFDRLRKMDRF